MLLLVGRIRYLLERGHMHRIAIVTETGLIALLAIAALGFAVLVLLRRSDFKLPPRFGDEVTSFPRSRFPHYRDIGIVLDDGLRLRVGLYRDKYLRFSREQYRSMRSRSRIFR